MADQSYVNIPAKKVPFSEKPLEERIKEYNRVSKKYPDRIPCIVTVAKSSKKTLPELPTEKFLVPKLTPVSHLLQVIRKKIELRADEGLFLFCGDTMAPLNEVIDKLVVDNKSPDHFLNFYLVKESTFG